MRYSIGKGFGAMGSLSIRACFLVAIVASLNCLCVQSVRAADGIVSNALIHRAGLTVEWFTHTGVSASGKLVDWQLNINEDNATTFFTITAGEYRESFSENEISPFGTPFGVEGGADHASIRKVIIEAQLKNDGITGVEVKIDQYKLPESTIYTLTSSGAVSSINADNGQTNWTVAIGDPRLPSIGIGVNDKYVAVINGSTLYCLQANGGKILWSHRCRYAVGASPTVTDEKIYVPLINGRLEAFSTKEDGFNSHAYVSTGESSARPLVTEKTVAWPTAHGDMNVAARFGTDRGIAYRMRADSAIVSSPTHHDETFYVTSLDGFVYAVDENRGGLKWHVSTGYSISQSPVPMGGFVYVINDNNELFKLDANSGADAPGWEKPRTDVVRFVGAGRTNLYFTDGIGNLKVISQGSGTTLTTVPFGSVDSVLSNLENDRLYVASRGTIQCVRETAHPIPHYHSNDFGPVELESKPDAEVPTSEPAEAKPVDLSNPFGSLDKPAEANPFGDNAKPAEEANPFGGNFGSDDGKNPFDTGKKEGDGGEVNPFGGK